MRGSLMKKVFLQKFCQCFHFSIPHEDCRTIEFLKIWKKKILRYGF